MDKLVPWVKSEVVVLEDYEYGIETEAVIRCTKCKKEHSYSCTGPSVNGGYHLPLKRTIQ